MREMSKEILDLLELEKVTQIQAIRQYKNYKNLSEGMYHSWPADKMRFKFISLLDDVKNQRLLDSEIIIGKRDKLTRYEYFKNIDVCAANDISKKLQLDEWQIRIFLQDDGLGRIIFTIPNREDNYDIVKKMMSFYGYFPIRKSHNKVNDLDYIEVQFMPNCQSIINDYLLIYSYAYHVCPSKYDHKIEKIGLVPKSRNDEEMYSYSGRIFLVMNVDLNDNELSDKDIRQIEIFANYLYGEKPRNSSNLYVDEKEYTIWKMDIQKALQEEVDLYFDYTDLLYYSIYTTDNIRPELLTKMKTIHIERS